MKLPGLGASALIIIAGVVIFYIPGVIAQILSLNGSQSTVTCTDTFCIELVLISFLGIFTIILGVFLTVIAFLNRPKHNTRKESDSAIMSFQNIFGTKSRYLPEADYGSFGTVILTAES